MAECQWDHWSEAGDCDNEATETITLFGESVGLCEFHAEQLNRSQIR